MHGQKNIIFLPLLKLVVKKVLSWVTFWKKNACIPRSFLVINVCNQGNTLCSPYITPPHFKHELYCSRTPLNVTKKILCRYKGVCRSRWLRGLRRGSAATRLPGLWVRIPPEAWMFVCCVVCCQVQVSATGRSLVRRSPTDCGVSKCNLETSSMRRPWPTGGLLRQIKKVEFKHTSHHKEHYRNNCVISQTQNTTALRPNLFLTEKKSFSCPKKERSAPPPPQRKQMTRATEISSVSISRWPFLCHRCFSLSKGRGMNYFKLQEAPGFVLCMR
jgi:hypothetical protein